MRLITIYIICKKKRGLYCPPLIPAGIWQNPGNSRNSRGIKFGRGACKIDEMILAELPGRNAAGIQQNGIDDAQIKLTLDLGVINEQCPLGELMIGRLFTLNRIFR